MRFSQRHFNFSSRPQHLWTSLLLIVVLLAHSLDNCAAHLGVPEDALQKRACSDKKNFGLSASGTSDSGFEKLDSLCCAPTDHEDDLCEVISEVSTPAPQGFELDAPLIADSTPCVSPPDIFVLIPPTGVLRSRDGPQVQAIASLCLRSTLPARSPPLSA